MDEAMLEVKGLSAGYGPVRALREVTLQAARGKVTAVLGANGAGKTTLLRTVSGLHRASAGSVHLDGQDITRTSPEQMSALGLAHVPEGRGVITQLTVTENLRLGRLGRSSTQPETSMEIDDVLDLFPRLAERRTQPADVLSGGERQMLVIGRALLAAPSVLLLDEPSLGLAPRVVAQIFAIVRDLVDREGLTVVLVEQNARSALSIADDAIVLNLGEVVVRQRADVLADDEALRHAYLGF